ncbi:MAG: NUDIX domain-containing protein [Patescibacteria group bacterium]|nr:NUDIX domain-containing protein [Patescibacteria group bacterium]
MEYLDVVNEKDEIIGEASRGDIYKKYLMHRIVHIFIFNKKGKICLQLRGKNISFMPLHWCSSAAGHVRKGETYKNAIRREMFEELGTDLDIKFLYKDVYEYKTVQPGLKLFLVTFKATNDGPFKINRKEVERVDFFSVKEVQKMIDRGEKFHPELLFLLQRHFKMSTLNNK